MALSPEEHVLIVGAGTFGLSTALELLRKGHKNLTILDPYPVPSPLSAGNDVNKILQSRVQDEFDSKLALEALAKWKNDPVYKPAYHETGIIYAGTGAEAVDEIKYRKGILKKEGKDITDLNTPQDFAKLLKLESDELSLEHLNLKDTRFTGWVGYHHKEDCGWVFASYALRRAGEECVKLGAKVVVDSADSFIFGDDGAVLGVKTYSGQLIYATKTVLAAGASSVNLLEFEGQLLAKAWTVGHIKLSESEAKLLKDSPVVLNLDEGFFFEPDSNNELKICNEFPGLINMSKNSTNKGPVSIPEYRNQLPLEAEKYIRSFVKQVYPQFAERPFSVAKICWCTDTVDRRFLFGDHPKHKGLVLGTGDSGKGFKYMPIIGNYLSELIINGPEGISEDKRKAWSWRPETAINRDVFHLQGRLGGNNKVEDIKDIKKWVNAKL